LVPGATGIVPDFRSRRGDCNGTAAPHIRVGGGGMVSNPILIPGPDHPITITESDAHVVVRAGGKVIADTRRALELREANYQPVWYIPREDADMTLLEPSPHVSYCPYKGAASYLSVRGGTENAVWSYEAPYQAVEAIRGHLAFYPDRVDAIDVSR
jgi:uncharacterized protein (DUF427 family)